MIEGLVFSTDPDMGRMFEYLFQKLGHSITHVESADELAQNHLDKPVDILILEGVNFIGGKDWQIVSNLFFGEEQSVPIIVTSWFWNDKLEAQYKALEIQDILIYPCDIPGKIYKNLRSLFQEESFNPWWESGYDI